MNFQDSNDSNIGNDINNGQYQGGASMGENGEYCYIYTPSDKRSRKNRRGSRAFMIFATCAVVLSVLIAASSLAFAMSLGRAKDASLGDDINGENYASAGDQQDNGRVNSVSGVLNESVTIEQSPSLGGNGLTSAGMALGSVSKVFAAVSDTVVEISTKMQVMGYYSAAGEGSGVIIDKSGYIVTNHHVIENASSITVRLTDGDEYTASIVGTCESRDLAVIKIDPDGKELACAKIGHSSELVVGEEVVAIGNPLGSLAGSATSGMISATERKISIEGSYLKLIQTDAAINPGNSGGGLFNMAGQLIGIVNAKVADEDVEGIGFAIPVDDALPILQDIITYGYAKNIADHGLSLLDATDRVTAASYGYSVRGIYVLASKYNSEIKSGDRIVAINGRIINSKEDISYVISSCAVGDTVSVTVARGRTQYTYDITLQEYVPDSVTFN